jgi:hypothetical protein
MGIVGCRLAHCSSVYALAIGVRKIPGATQLTRTFLAACWAARTIVSPITPPFDTT